MFIHYGTGEATSCPWRAELCSSCFLWRAEEMLNAVSFLSECVQPPKESKVLEQLADVQLAVLAGLVEKGIWLCWVSAIPAIPSSYRSNTRTLQKEHAIASGVFFLKQTKMSCRDSAEVAI